MRRNPLLTAAGLVMLLVGSMLGGGLAQGASQATNTPEPIVIEFATSTPTEAATATASKDSPAEPTSTPRVFQIATLSPTESAAPTEQVAQEPPTPTVTAEASAEVVEFDASDWVGGFYQSDPELQEYYGRPWVAVYGAQSDYPQATLAFELGAVPQAPVAVTVLGLDDELAALNPIAVEINDRRVYEGEDFFANWNAVSGDPSVWSEIRLTIDPSLLDEGVNTLTLLNLDPAPSFNGPPYFLLGAGSIATMDVEVELASLDQGAVALQAGDGNRGNSEVNRQDDTAKPEKEKKEKKDKQDNDDEDDGDDDESEDDSG